VGAGTGGGEVREHLDGVKRMISSRNDKGGSSVASRNVKQSVRCMWPARIEARNRAVRQGTIARGEWGSDRFQVRKRALNRRTL